MHARQLCRAARDPRAHLLPDALRPALGRSRYCPPSATGWKQQVIEELLQHDPEFCLLSEDQLQNQLKSYDQVVYNL